MKSSATFPLLLFSLPLIFAPCPFQRATLSPAFVDKSQLLRTFLSSSVTSSYIVTAPQYFGKTTNLVMLRRFFEICRTEKQQRENAELFFNPTLNLSITYHRVFLDRNFGKYPVIHLYLLIPPTANTTKSVVEFIKASVCRAFYPHKWLYETKIEKNTTSLKYPSSANIRQYNRLCIQTDIETPIGALKESISMLSTDLTRHYRKRTIVLADDFDSPIMVSMRNGLNVTGITSLISSILAGALDKYPGYVTQCMLAGTVDILRHEYGGMGLTNFFHLQFLLDHPMTPYFGFTSTEMQNLYSSSKFNPPVSQEERDYLERCYNGYVSQDNKTRLYNPISVTEYFRNRGNSDVIPRKFECANYWPKSNYLAKFEMCLNETTIYQSLLQLVLNTTSTLLLTMRFELTMGNYFNELFLQNCSLKDDQQIEFYWTLLFEIGYLTYTDIPGYVKLPNLEVKQFVAKKLRVTLPPSTR